MSTSGPRRDELEQALPLIADAIRAYAFREPLPERRVVGELGRAVAAATATAEPALRA